MDDLDVDKKAAKEGKTKLSSHGDNAKAYTKASTPVFGTQLYAIMAFPLKVKHI